MAKYRAIVSIEFDDDDLTSFAESTGVEESDPCDAVSAELDNFPLGSAYVEQFYKNGRPTIHRMGGDGIEVTINDHDLDGFEEEEDGDFELDDEGDDD